MSDPAQNLPLPSSSPEPELARAQLGLVRVLPWVHARARRQLPAWAIGRLGSSPEDMVQLAALAALGRMESAARRTAALPDWCASEAALRRYLSGILWRLVKRLIRDSNADRTEQVEPELLVGADRKCPLEQAEERTQARACLAHLTPAELDLIEGIGRGASYAEMSAFLRASPATLAKRRERILQRLRARCLGCSFRKAGGCSWIPPNWTM